MPRRLAHTFPVDDAMLWRALRNALPAVTAQASFWEHERRVEWSEDWSAFSWGQVFDATVEAGGEGSSQLVLTSRSHVRTSLADRGRFKAVYKTLVDGVERALAPAPGSTQTSESTPEDRVRYWNGEEWTIEPPPSPV